MIEEEQDKIYDEQEHPRASEDHWEYSVIEMIFESLFEMLMTSPYSEMKRRDS